MTAALATTLLAGIGLLLLLTAQPLGRPRPSLAQQLARLRLTQPPPALRPPERVFTLPGLDRLLLPALQATGQAILSVAARLGVDPARLARRLALVGDTGGVTVLYASMLVLGLLGVSLPPLLGVLAGAGVTGVPAWVWLAAGAIAASLPQASLQMRVRRQQHQLTGQIAMLGEYLALATSAGLGLEQALAETATASQSRLFAELGTRLAHARLARQPGTQAISSLAADYELPDLAALAGVLEASHTYGTSLTEALSAHTAAIRERRRLALLAAGQQAQVLMLLPTALLILPALLLLLLFPLGANLLGLATPQP